MVWKKRVKGGLIVIWSRNRKGERVGYGWFRGWEFEGRGVRKVRRGISGLWEGRVDREVGF